MIELKKRSLLADVEYEDYDKNVVSSTTLTLAEQKELGLIRSCCGSTGGCSKKSGAGSCCGSTKKCPKN